MTATANLNPGDRVRPLVEADLRQLFDWRNHPDIRRFMYNQNELAWPEHQAWFARSQAEDGRHLLIFETEQGPNGFVNLGSVKPGGIADWGFYAAPGAERGTGSRLGRTALDYAFGKLLLHKVCGQALGFNAASIAFHQRLGFKREGVLRDQFFDGSTYVDVVHFGLLASEYLSTDGGGGAQ